MKVIKYVNLPTRLPVVTTAVHFLLLDKFSAPMWVWGAWGAVMVMFWIAVITRFFTQQTVDVFGSDYRDHYLGGGK